MYNKTVLLLQSEIDFIPNPGFLNGNIESDDFVQKVLNSTHSSTKTSAILPAYLRRLCESDLLTREQEMVLFRTMNHLKFHANSLRTRLNPETFEESIVSKIESLLSDAEKIRDHIIKSNLRLVISIVKKFVTPQHPFDELLSDSMLTLMKAVDKFDFDRGFRFSTYAYRSVSRDVYTSIKIARIEESRVTRDAEEWAFEQQDDESLSLMSDQTWSNIRELTASMLSKLDRRERFIVRCRYALGGHHRVRSFQYLADKLGVSKERVRQLEKRAVNKLKNIASDYDMDELFGAAMA